MTRQKLIRVNEAAKILDIPQEQLYSYVRRGLLPHVRVGRVIRFDPIQLEEFIERGGTKNEI